MLDADAPYRAFVATMLLRGAGGRLRAAPSTNPAQRAALTPAPAGALQHTYLIAPVMIAPALIPALLLPGRRTPGRWSRTCR